MLRNSILGLSAAALLASAASAQFCSDNLYHLYLVDAAGNVAPSTFDAGIGENVYQFATEAVYLAFDPSLPSGTYYVHVTDTPIDGLDEVLSTNDPMDRFVSVTNNAGVITLSLPFTNNQDPVTYGVGLNGVGQSILLTPFRSSTYSPCKWKAWYGDSWNLDSGPDNPYLLNGGVKPNGQCAVRSYESFAIGDGNGSDVSGTVFLDADRDGVRDAGEGGLANWEVQLVTDSTSVSATTDADGHYVFHNVAAGSYSLELVLGTNYVATTAGSFDIDVCACGDVNQDFGAATSVLTCHPKPPCFWKSCHGMQKMHQCGTLWSLPALCLVNTWGQHCAPGSLLGFHNFHRQCNSWNMGYSLSCELSAMHANITCGYVDPNCVIQDPCLGSITVGNLCNQAIASLCAHPYTPPGYSSRTHQNKLKNALQRANCNKGWR
jgi:hypothetical protein